MTTTKIKEVEQWFELANKNFLTAKLLFDNEMYSDCAYYSQQSSEKAAKTVLTLLDEQIYEHKIATEFYDIVYIKYPYEYIEEIYFLLSELETHWLKSRYILKTREGKILNPKDIYSKKKANDLLKKSAKVIKLIQKFLSNEFDLVF